MNFLRAAAISFILSGLLTIGLMVFVFALSAVANDDIIGLQGVSLEYKRFVAPGRHVLLYPESPKEGINLNVNMNLFGSFFWDNQVGSLTTDSQYRAIWLNTRLGFSPFSFMDVQYTHLSQHLLERSHAFIPRYPVEDSVGVVIHLFRSKSDRGSWW